MKSTSTQLSTLGGKLNLEGSTSIVSLKPDMKNPRVLKYQVVKGSTSTVREECLCKEP